MKKDRSWLTPNEAGKLAGFTGRHILNLISSGKISATRDDVGRFYIDKSEFFRVFPQAIKEEATRSGAKKEEINQIGFLQTEIDHLKEMLDEKRRQNDFLKEQLETFSEEKSKMLDAINSHARLLEYKDTGSKSDKKPSEGGVFGIFKRKK